MVKDTEVHNFSDLTFWFKLFKISWNFGTLLVTNSSNRQQYYFHHWSRKQYAPQLLHLKSPFDHFGKQNGYHDEIDLVNSLWNKLHDEIHPVHSRWNVLGETRNCDETHSLKSSWFTFRELKFWNIDTNQRVLTHSPRWAGNGVG